MLAGAVGEEIQLTPPANISEAERRAWRDALWDQLVAWLAEGRTLGAMRAAEEGVGEFGETLSDGGAGLAAQGLVAGRGYGVLCAGSLQGEKLLRLRCPNDVEFTGEWSDHSDKWTVRTRQLLNYPKSAAGTNDGFFWMGFPDFLTHFDTLVCATAQRPGAPTAQQVFRHQWGGACAGGSPLFLSWRRNPQFLVAAKPGQAAVTLHVKLEQSQDAAAGLIGGARGARA